MASGRDDYGDMSGFTAPHGPFSARSAPIHEMNQNERAIFDYLIKPDDMYTSDGVYWADLPLLQQLKFSAASDAKEAKKELGSIGQMMEKDPLSPVGWYFRNAVIPGAGLGLEG